MPYVDSRGSFMRCFCSDVMKKILKDRNVLQINQSCTTAVGAIRGLHFQYPPYAEMKMIRCIKGRVWDVAIDLRKGSKTFLKWYAQELSADNNKMMVIPEGCAHGFQVMEPESELIYLHTAFYEKSYEGGVRFDDPQISINWPLEVTEISQKDEQFELLPNEFKGI